MLYWPVGISRLLPPFQDPQLGWLVPKALRAYAMVAKHRYTVERRQNLLLLLDQANFVDKWLLVRGSWELAQLRYLTRAIKEYCDKPAIFLDVGAHGGLYALAMRDVKRFDRILAFEPDIRNFAQLQANLLMNDALEDIEAHNCAISSVDGRISIHQGENRVVTQVGEAVTSALSISSVRLDSVLSLAGYSICCKIDVEGHELEVLNGMTGLWEHNDILLQIEIHDARTKDMLEYLREKGFTFIQKIAPHDYFFSRRSG